MPYLKFSERLGIDEGIWSVDTPGDLNYAICKLVIAYVNRKGLSYQTINDVSGAVNEALAEFRRRVVAPYEDRKIQENGDLPWPALS